MGVIKKNIMAIKKYIGPEVLLAAVIKSNAYGHGIIEVVRAVSQVGVEFLCVDNVAEATAISKQFPASSKILILGGVESEDLDWVIKNNVRLALFNSSHPRTFERSSQRCGRRAKVHIKIDTGMHRLGIDANEAVEVITKINNNYKNIEIEGIWSHFADSGSRENKKYTQEQIKKFSNIVDQIEKDGIQIKYKHLCNSAGAINYPEARFNLVRTGIIIYGIFPSEYIKKKYQKKINVKPALSFKTKIVSLRDLPKGERIGYGLAYRLKKNSKIAVLPVGYKDGYGRSLSNIGEVIVRGRRCPIVGRICMRMMMVDVSSVSRVKLNDEVILLGGDGRVRIEADEVAEKMDTIPYEILARIAESVPRIYKK
ncbi:MAG: alanine racemase [Candidatus Berkelbacteria bacterium Licking1014_96]|uniref:Alanine racemase n=1 Tax=Candidatus Berkelbacteria bacterium Licking1014_96 TaxID=2017149 RepID=A0A554LEH0_9BACT|nr:MAG: alanine racemase [Candidatus Berkelbacteria bacterium Licking1014_96]